MCLNKKEKYILKIVSEAGSHGINDAGVTYPFQQKFPEEKGKQTSYNIFGSLKKRGLMKRSLFASEQYVITRKGKILYDTNKIAVGVLIIILSSLGILSSDFGVKTASITILLLSIYRLAMEYL